MTDQPSAAQRIEIAPETYFKRIAPDADWWYFHTPTHRLESLWSSDQVHALVAAIQADRQAARNQALAEARDALLAKRTGDFEWDAHQEGAARAIKALINTPTPAARPVVDREALRDMIAKAVFDTGDDVPLGRPARLAADRILVVLAKAGALTCELAAAIAEPSVPDDDLEAIAAAQAAGEVGRPYAEFRAELKPVLAMCRAYADATGVEVRGDGMRAALAAIAEPVSGTGRVEVTEAAVDRALENWFSGFVIAEVIACGGYGDVSLAELRKDMRAALEAALNGGRADG